jgi:hypothetical protein
MSARDDYPSLYEFARHDPALAAERADAWRAMREIDRLRSKLDAIGKIVSTEDTE